MIAVIAEKPSVGKDIARVLGANVIYKGYMEGNGYVVTWAFGHLTTLALPEDYRAEGYEKEDLPILPDPFRLIPRKVKGKNGYVTDPSAFEQLKIIGQVFSRCDNIIVATDAGREGELIFRYIYNYLECVKPFSRLWISSLTDYAIREGLNKLKDGKEYDSLYLAAEARSKADWMIGINTSRALCRCLGSYNNSLGRVQTPTLAMICKRYDEYRGFKPCPYWEILVQIEKEKKFFLNGTEQYFDKTEANRVFAQLRQQQTVRVSKIEKKETKEEPPLLHDLAALQKEANIKYGYSADKTLSTAQRLYELKYTTYPRTGSRYITEDIFNTVPYLLGELTGHADYGRQSQDLSAKGRLNRKCVDASKVTDHHAIIITGILPSVLNEAEKKIYDLIAQRFIESFSDAQIKDVTTIDFDCAGVLFHSKGWIVKEKGWRSVCGNDREEDTPDNQLLPEIKEGEMLPVLNYNMTEKKTKPTPLFTEASLLTAMQTAGKSLKDEETKEAMKEIGIGTPATRAAIIETLLSRGYILREKKNMIPSPKGMEIFKAVKDMRISDVEMTGRWEMAIHKIEQEPDYCSIFLEEMKILTKQMTDEIISVNLNKENIDASPFICPKCKRGKLVFFPKIVRCNNSSCKHILYRKKNDLILTDKNLSDLFRTGSTGLLEGFKNKNGHLFDAAIELDNDHNLTFDFSDNYKKNNARRKDK